MEERFPQMEKRPILARHFSREFGKIQMLGNGSMMILPPEESPL